MFNRRSVDFKAISRGLAFDWDCDVIVDVDNDWASALHWFGVMFMHGIPASIQVLLCPFFFIILYSML